jgi:hypothetical protein
MSIKNKVTGELSNITTYGTNGRISDITLPGNVTAGANVNANTLNVTSLSKLGNVGNVYITGGTAGQAIITDGAGNLTWGNAGSTITAVPAVYFVAPANGNAQTFSNVILSSYTANTDMTVFYNGSLLPSEYYTLSGQVLTVNTLMFTGDTIDVIRQVAGNVINVTSGYTDSNVTALLSSGSVSSNVITTANISGDYILGNGSQLTGLPAGYANTNVNTYLNGGLFTGNFIPNGDATQDLGNSTNQWKDLWLSGNTLYMSQVPVSLTGNTLQVDGANVVTSTAAGNINAVGNINAAGMTITGNAIITGNANVQGTLTFNNTTSITTSNLVLGLGNNQSGINVTGGGIVVGSTAEAQFLYDQPNQTWDSNLGITATGNITAPYFIGDGSQLTGLPASYGNANVTTLLASGTVTSNVITTGNISGNYILGNGAFLTGIFGTEDYLQAGRITTSQAGVGLNTDLIFNSVTAQSGTSQISLNTTTGVVSLKAGVTYNLTASPSFGIFTNTTSGFLTYTWVDAVTNTPLVAGISGASTPATLTSADANQQLVSVVYTPSTNQTVKVRVLSASGTAGLRTDFGFLSVTQIGVSAGATSFTNLTVTGNVNTSNLNSIDLYGSGQAILGNTANAAATKLRLTTFASDSYIQTGNGTVNTTGNIIFAPWSSGTQSVVINTTNGNVTAAGNVAANYFIGNGSQLTGVTTNPSELNWSAAGTIQAVGFTATTTPATLATSPTKNQVYYKQLGPKTYQVSAIYYQTSTTGASNGLGDYLFTLPAGLQFDTSLQFQQVYSTVGTTGPILGAFAIPGSTFACSTSSTFSTSAIVPYSSTLYRIIGTVAGTDTRFVGAGWAQVAAAASMSYSWSFTFQTP